MPRSPGFERVDVVANLKLYVLTWMKLSVVIPIYNEESVIDHTLVKFHSIFSAYTNDFEMICIDDGSTDHTWERLVSIAKKLPEVHALRFSRNFGHDAALFAGFEQARGEIVGTMDCDGEHPPEVLLDMVKELERTGVDVVNGIKISRGNRSFFNRIAVSLFGLMLSKSLNSDLSNATEFKVLRRAPVETLKKFRDFHFFYRGLVPWIGFTQGNLMFEPAVRSAGRSHWSFTGLVRFAISGLILFSNFPLRIFLYVGAAGITLGALFGVKLAVDYCFGYGVSSINLITLLLLLILGVVSLGLGVLGLYLFATFRQAMGRPRAVVREQIIRGQHRDELFFL